MGRRSGYNYSYRFSVEDDIIPLYRPCLCAIGPHKGFLFEIRTNFKLKRVDHDDDGQMMIGSERFGAAVREGQDESWSLENQTSFRLKDYWMSDDEIQSLVRDASDFAKRQRATAGTSVSVIPVVVGLDVWTVQQYGEDINATIDGAIRPQRLIPIYIWPIVPEAIMQQDTEIEQSYLNHKSLLWELPRIRVEDEAGLVLMKVCPVCSRNPIIGAQISFLPNCKHACHSHCVFEWLRKRNTSCPVCGVRIPSDWERSRKLVPPPPTDIEDPGSDSDSDLDWERLREPISTDLERLGRGSDSDLDSFSSHSWELDSLDSFVSDLFVDNLDDLDLDPNFNDLDSDLISSDSESDSSSSDSGDSDYLQVLT